MTFNKRFIPILLKKGNGLVKGVKFRNHKYIGDHLNTVKIFNSKEIDELIFIDIGASEKSTCISVDLVKQLSDECYMPFAVGGGIQTLNQIRELISAGAEKVCINTSFFNSPDLINEASQELGSQSIVVSLDIKKNIFGSYKIFTSRGTKKIGSSVETVIKEIEDRGAGEILLNCIDRDGMMIGYDKKLIRKISEICNIPLIVAGGAGKYEDLYEILSEYEVSAAAAGSLFVYHGAHRAVLINYPTVKKQA